MWEERLYLEQHSIGGISHTTLQAQLSAGIWCEAY